MICSARVQELPDYIASIGSTRRVLDMLVGDTQRLWVYAHRGFAAPQQIDDRTYASYERLVAAGYTMSCDMTSANPPKNDAWPEPRHWLHVWVHRQRRNYPPPMPGLVLKWEKHKGRWRAWVIWVDTTYAAPEIRHAWLPLNEIRPAKSSMNIWNDRYR